MTNSDYTDLKRELKTWSKPQIKKLCDDMEMCDTNRDLLLAWYNGESVIKISMENYFTPKTYHDHMKKLFTRIYNYRDYCEHKSKDTD